jgi:hypothetical protein
MMEEAVGVCLLVCTVYEGKATNDESRGVACCMLSLGSTAVGRGALMLLVCVVRFLYA